MVDAHPVLVAQRAGYLQVRLLVPVAVGRGRVVGEAALGHGLVPAHVSTAEPMGLRLVATASCVERGIGIG